MTIVHQMEATEDKGGLTLTCPECGYAVQFKAGSPEKETLAWGQHGFHIKHTWGRKGLCVGSSGNTEEPQGADLPAEPSATACKIAH